MRLPRVFLVALLLLFVSALNAQTIRFTGRVLDPTGAVMPRVDVKIFQGANTLRETKTDAAGNFALDLPAGEYRLEATAPDYRLYQQALRVVPNMAPLSISMAVAAPDSKVDVPSQTDRVNLDEAANLTSTTIAGDALKDLPEDEESLMAYLQALVGGAPGEQVNIVVDGFTGGRIPPRELIQQVIIDRNVFSADSTGGARIQIVTRPGTGSWTGGASFSFRDSGLNAMTPYALTKPDTQQRSFSTNYGGPVIPGFLTMRFNGSITEYELEGNALRAITPDGARSDGVTSPSKNRNLNLTGQLYLNMIHTVNFNVSYTSSNSENQGIGGFNLPERASNSKNHSWQAQFIERAIFNPTTINELRFRAFRTNSSQEPVTDAIAINVLDAFYGGGAQNRSNNRNLNYNFGDTLRWQVKPPLNLQIGVDATYMKNRSVNENNYRGTFVFSSLEDYLAGRPVTFTQTTGDPSLEVSQWQAAAFLQSDWRMHPKVNLSMGVRYQIQTNLKDNNNIAPTVGFAYQPRQGTVIRAGARISHQIFNIGSVEQLLRQDGKTRQFQTVITNPSYPDPFLNGTGSTTGITSTSFRVQDPNLAAPYSFNTQVSLEQNLVKGWRFGASINATRGVRLIRTRNINAPYPGTPLSDELLTRLNSFDPAVQAAAREEVDRMRPYYPIAGNILQFESTGKSLSKNLSFRIMPPANLTLWKIGLSVPLTQYTLGWAHDDASAQNQYDWASEWAPASGDTRHRVESLFMLRLPKAVNASFTVTAASGRPYTVTTGRDENGDQTTNDRPAGVPRNSVRSPGTYNVSMSLSKTFNLKKPEPARPANNAFAEPQQVIVPAGGQPIIIAPAVVSAGAPGVPNPGPRLTFSVNVNNLLNNTQVRGYSGVLTSPLFGKPTGAAAGRSMYLSMSFNF